MEERTWQLRQAQAKLVKAERLAAIGELAAIIGHDLRNPLTGIMGATYYLKTKFTPKLGAKGKEMLETIEKAISYSNKIINDLLEYSQDLKLEYTGVNPKALLQKALSTIEVPKKIRVVDATDSLLKFKADEEKMREAFTRIIQNAIDAMPLECGRHDFARRRRLVIVRDNDSQSGLAVYRLARHGRDGFGHMRSPECADAHVHVRLAPAIRRAHAVRDAGRGRELRGNRFVRHAC